MAHQVKVLENTPQTRSLVANPAYPKIASVPVAVTGGSAGPKTFVQKIQSAYKTVVVFVGAILALLTQIGPLMNFIPESQRVYYTGAVLFLTAVSTFLVQNQKFVDEL